MPKQEIAAEKDATTRQKHLDELLDEALRESLPASDPPAIAVEEPVPSSGDETSKSARLFEQRPSSPRIAGLVWGKLNVEGVGTFKDVKVFPGGAQEWDWSESGTAHDPGIQPRDVQELLDHGATTIILSQGMMSRLQVCPDTLRLLELQGAETYVLATPAAVELYNRLRDRGPVGGLFHTTC